MLFTTIITLFLSATVLAVPTALQVRADESCAPSNYTIAGFLITTTDDGHADVSFNFKSRFADLTGITDVIANGTTCHADGSPIPNSGNLCNNSQRKMIWDLREPQDKTHYQFTHTWVCNGATWMSGTDVKIDAHYCVIGDDIKDCAADNIIMVKPQNVRKICGTPIC